MALETSTVHRKLETKVKISGFELIDLLFVLLFSSLMNLVFGRTYFAFLLVFVLPGAIALVLYFGKRNKPDDYLKHLFRYLISPGVYSASLRKTMEERV